MDTPWIGGVDRWGHYIVGEVIMLGMGQSYVYGGTIIFNLCSSNYVKSRFFCVCVCFQLLGERSEPHTGVLNRDFS